MRRSGTSGEIGLEDERNLESPRAESDFECSIKDISISSNKIGRIVAMSLGCSVVFNII